MQLVIVTDKRGPWPTFMTSACAVTTAPSCAEDPGSRLHHGSSVTCLPILQQQGGSHLGWEAPCQGAVPEVYCFH